MFATWFLPFWLAVSTIGVWAFFDRLSLARFRIPASVTTLLGAVIPVFWLFLGELQFHRVNPLLFGILSIAYFQRRDQETWQPAASIWMITAEMLTFLWFPVWQTQVQTLVFVVGAELVAFWLASTHWPERMWHPPWRHRLQSPLWSLPILWIPDATTPINRWQSFIFLVPFLLFLGMEGERLRQWRRRSHDPLTDLANRYQLQDDLNTWQHKDGVIVALNVDGFKALKDTLGRTGSDALLAEIGTRLREAGHGLVQMAYHWEGDEFIVVFPGLAALAAMQALDKLHETLVANPYAIPGGETIALRIGLIGIEGRLTKTLLEETRDRLTEAKRQGANQVMFHAKGEKTPVPIRTIEAHLHWVASSLRDLTAASKKGVMITNERRQILDVNTSFETMSGYEKAELMGKTPRILASPTHLNQAKYPDVLRQLREQGYWEGAWINRKKNGEIWSALTEISIIKLEGELIGYWAMVKPDLLRHLEEDLLYALERQEILLYFQPKCQPDGVVVGAEVLMRWRHHEEGMISPAKFIPIAEEKGMIDVLGQFALLEACKWIRRMEDTGAIIPLSVNVSAVQFQTPYFVDSVQETLRLTGVDPAHLTLEVTESVMVVGAAEAAKKLQALRDLGIKVSMDDFGTGYSSLAYLQSLPMDELKIDQAFLRGMNQHSEVILGGIFTMAKQMQLATVVEGVETKPQLDLVTALGGDVIQGYYFSKPIPADQFFSEIEPGKTWKITPDKGE